MRPHFIKFAPNCTKRSSALKVFPPSTAGRDARQVRWLRGQEPVAHMAATCPRANTCRAAYHLCPASIRDKSCTGAPARFPFSDSTPPVARPCPRLPFPRSRGARVSAREWKAGARAGMLWPPRSRRSSAPAGRKIDSRRRRNVSGFLLQETAFLLVEPMGLEPTTSTMPR